MPVNYCLFLLSRVNKLVIYIISLGLQIVRNFDEVAFVQNLVYYIESGYRTPVGIFLLFYRMYG